MKSATNPIRFLERERERERDENLCSEFCNLEVSGNLIIKFFLSTLNRVFFYMGKGRKCTYFAKIYD